MGGTLGQLIAGTRAMSLIHSRVRTWQSIEGSLGYGAAVLEGGLGLAQGFGDKNRM